MAHLLTSSVAPLKCPVPTDRVPRRDMVKSVLSYNRNATHAAIIKLRLDNTLRKTGIRDRGHSDPKRTRYITINLTASTGIAGQKRWVARLNM